MTAALPKDVTGALRARRYRHRRRQQKNGSENKVGVTVGADRRVTVSTIEMCALAARLGDGRASPGDLKLAERLIMALVDRLPADSAFQVR
jgi:hypothetical protein